MSFYVLLSRVSPDAIKDPKEFRVLAKKVAEKIEEECPDVKWRHSWATMGHYDVVDVVESSDPRQVEKAAMIIRSYGHSTTETMPATPWKEFIGMLEEKTIRA